MSAVLLPLVTLLALTSFGPVTDVAKIAKQLAETLAASRRSLDIVGRLGGEEFAILLPGADVDAAARAAEAIRGKVEELDIEVAPGTSAPITVSIGGAGLDGDLAGALGRADAALYRAKSGGRNRVTVDTVPSGDVAGEDGCHAG